MTRDCSDGDGVGPSAGVCPDGVQLCSEMLQEALGGAGLIPDPKRRKRVKAQLESSAQRRSRVAPSASPPPAAFPFPRLLRTRLELGVVGKCVTAEK